MTQQENKNLEDYVERFQYNLQISRWNGLNDDTLKIILLRGIKDDCIDLLNLIGAGDVSLLKYVEISDHYRRYSRNASRRGRGIRDTLIMTTKTSREGFSRMEIENLFEGLKIDILSSLSSQLNALQEKIRQEEEDRDLNICFPKCRKRHPLKRYPLDKVETCLLCDQDHPTKDFPSLPGLKAIYKEAGADAVSKPVCFISQKCP